MGDMLIADAGASLGGGGGSTPIAMQGVNPLELASKRAALENQTAQNQLYQNQNQEFQLKIASQNAMQQAMKRNLNKDGSINYPGLMQEATSNPALAYGLHDNLKASLDNQNSQQQLQENQFKTASMQRNWLFQHLESVIDSASVDPATGKPRAGGPLLTKNDIENKLAEMHADPFISTQGPQFQAQLDNMEKNLRGYMTDDPGHQAQAYRFINNGYKQNLAQHDYEERMLGKTSTVNTGGETEFVNTRPGPDGTAATPVIQSKVNNTLAPDSAAALANKDTSVTDPSGIKRNVAAADTGKSIYVPQGGSGPQTLVNANPNATPGSGPIVDQGMNEGTTKAWQDTDRQYQESAASATGSIQQMDKLAEAAKGLATGKYFSWYNNIANTLEGLGVPHDIAQSFVPGDNATKEDKLVKAQLMMKYMTRVAASTAQDSFSKSHMTQAEYEKIANEGSPNDALQPETIDKIVAFNKKLALQAQHKGAAFNGWKQEQLAKAQADQKAGGSGILPSSSQFESDFGSEIDKMYQEEEAAKSKSKGK